MSRTNKSSAPSPDCAVGILSASHESWPFAEGVKLHTLEGVIHIARSVSLVAVAAICIENTNIFFDESSNMHRANNALVHVQRNTTMFKSSALERPVNLLVR